MSQDELLFEFFADWQTAERELASAQTQAMLKQARFKGAAELVYGPNFKYEFKDGQLTFSVSDDDLP
jgi:hypothetical protein